MFNLVEETINSDNELMQQALRSPLIAAMILLALEIEASITNQDARTSWGHKALRDIRQLKEEFCAELSRKDPWVLPHTLWLIEAAQKDEDNTTHLWEFAIEAIRK